MIGVPGTAHRLFGALREAEISVMLISQGSSEHSICFAIPAAQAGSRRARRARRALRRELRDGPDPEHRGHRDCASSRSSVTAWPARPESPASCSARSATPASTCARSPRVPPSAISRRSSTGGMPRAVRAVHAGFYLSPQTVSIGLIGPGTVGARAAGSARVARRRGLRRDCNLDLRVRGIATFEAHAARRPRHRSRQLARGAAAHGEPLDLGASPPTSPPSTCHTR